MRQYRDKVEDHFLQTADLVNDMTQAYRSVHEHLSKGAQVLCSEVGRKRAVAKSLDSAPDKENSEPMAPPLDYAPSAKGTLSEDFGLQQKPTGPFAPVDVADNPIPDTVVEPPRDYAEGDDDTADDKKPS